MASVYNDVTTYIGCHRTKVILFSSAVGAGVLLYIAQKFQWSRDDEKKQRRLEGVPLNIIKDEIARKRPKYMKEKTVDGSRTTIVAVKDSHQGSQYKTVAVADSTSSIVSSIMDLAIGDENFQNDAVLLKAMSDLDSAISQLEKVMVSRQMTRAPLYTNYVSKNVTIQSEINKLRSLLDVATSTGSFQTINVASQQKAKVVSSFDDDYYENHVLSYEECALHKTTDDEDTLVNDDLESVASDDSFVSAAESLHEQEEELLQFEPVDADDELRSTIRDLRDKYGHFQLYSSALDYFCQSGVSVRSLRTRMVGCENDVDFCVKVHCLRQGFEELLRSQTMHQWFVELGRNLISSMLKKTDRDYKAFELDFDSLVRYCHCEENWSSIQEELTERRVCFMSFYDIILDFIIMDAFEDLENPPYAVTTAVQNRWLSDRIKETALTTAVWSILKAKKQLLVDPQGFLGKMYDVSQHVSPVLAWGFLGPVEDVRRLCDAFKDATLGFLQDLFSIEKMKYNSVSSLADSIFLMAEARKYQAAEIITY